MDESRTNIDDFLTVRGFGGAGMYNGSYNRGTDYAGPTSNAVRIKAAAAASATGLENLLDQNQFEATNKNVVDGVQRMCDKMDTNSNRQSDLTTNSEFRASDRLRDVERLVIDGQKEAAACCCAAQLEACKSTAEIKALVIEENSRTREQLRGDALVVANAELTALKTQIACGCCTPSA